MNESAQESLLQAYGELLRRAAAAEYLAERVQAYVDLYGETASGRSRPAFEMLRSALSEYSVLIYGDDETAATSTPQLAGGE